MSYSDNDEPKVHIISQIFQPEKSLKGGVISRIMTSQDVHILIPGNCENLAFHGKWDFANVIIQRNLRHRDYSRLREWV